jgi:hypothetical protein
VKNYNCLVPDILQRFFLAEFNIEKFKEDNECMLREYAIKNYINNTRASLLFYDIKEMLTCYFTGSKKINIDIDFPKEKLKEIMTPYLHLYFTSTHSLSLIKKNNARAELKKKLALFYNYNPLFGRKNIKIITDKSLHTVDTKISFVDNHINFNTLDNNTRVCDHRILDLLWSEPENNGSNNISNNRLYNLMEYDMRNNTISDNESNNDSINESTDDYDSEGETMSNDLDSVS